MQTSLGGSGKDIPREDHLTQIGGRAATTPQIMALPDACRSPAAGGDQQPPLCAVHQRTSCNGNYWQKVSYPESAAGSGRLGWGGGWRKEVEMYHFCFFFHFSSEIETLLLFI